MKHDTVERDITDVLGLPGKGRTVVSAVGAGGKTSLLRRLAEGYVRRGQQVIVTTTTHMMAEPCPWFLLEPSEEKLHRILTEYGQAWVGTPASQGKMQGVSPEFMEKIWNTHLPVLIEADGARRLPLKVPGEREPVILPETTHVMSVYGMDAVGRPLEEICFRPERAAFLLNKKTTDPVTEEDIAFLAASEEAGRKGCPGNAVYTVVLNKADDDRRRSCASLIRRRLMDMGVENVVISCLGGPEAGDREADGI
ncbi:hypothetical protein B5F07_03445 [Lachnoclostridium sp. An169]|uniref:selenium cofactor biosynthesis protein YqeC n=1 Tax=Lachnoclostridium sp. An169 TaxID=1965569 RepID=UPI000B383FDA|nr:selenium cofactor biosynthesis protein YqeC [Lachnoclostridium sp. An169]OUP85732.1 hypothetical protein B5F07_03445 [Lachnoclostridium sp. An169]HJA65092.1 putative selenium-dependent hydroxylase accessory protein YqeC [Candidatus Mediterraneibacter cottocaccae]